MLLDILHNTLRKFITMTTLNNNSANSESILSPIQAGSLRNYLKNQGVNNIGRIEVFSSITSTSDYLAQKKIISKNEMVVCLAEEQTQGRGRFGHQWLSPPGVNLYLSMLRSLSQWSRQYEILSLWLLIAIAELLERLKFNGIQLKWPNDICFQNKKLGGILIERKSNQSSHHLIIGIGLNIAMSKIKDTKPENAWIDLISIRPDWVMSRNEFAAHVISSLSKTLDSLENNVLANLSSTWSRYDLMRHRRVEFTYENQRNVGIAQGIDELGQIIMQINGKVQHLHSAHVSKITI